MTLFEEARRFGKSMIGWLYVFAPLFIFFFAFGLKEVSLGGKTLLLPYPSMDSIAAQVLKAMQRNLLGGETRLIVTSPMDAFSALAQTSFWFAFIVSLPILLYKLMSYISPALYLEEKRSTLFAILPSVVLFLAGNLFAYFLIIPSAIKILYQYAISLDAEPFITTNKFIGFVLGTMLFSGILFLTPVLMAVLTKIGAVPSLFWKENWRYALAFFATLSALVTPDGTGITMVILTAPLLALYFTGYVVSR
ncbi:MAG: twin-arginine translocase subunit TatC [bacterium]|nr:twin-arginine translocase subunit TatC [bacterium]